MSARRAAFLPRLGDALATGWRQAPLTVVYVVVFTASTVLQRTMPAQWVEQVTSWSSTNVVRLAHHPLRVLLASALWIADGGEGYLLYLAVFLLVVVWAERRLGTRRLLAIALATHVVASLLVAALEWVMIRTGAEPAGLATTTDVGISYVMLGGCVAAASVLPPRWKAGAALALAAAVLAPVLADGDLWDAGHVIALACAATAAWAVLRLAPLSPADLRAPLSAGPAV